MDEQQEKRFKEALERKHEDAEEKAAEGQASATGSAVGDDQPGLTDTATTQDARSPRDKNSRHKQVTADGWNQ